MPEAEVYASDDELFAKMSVDTAVRGFHVRRNVSERWKNAVGLEETMDLDVISQTPIFVGRYPTNCKSTGFRWLPREG